MVGDILGLLSQEGYGTAKKLKLRRFLRTFADG